MGVGLGVAHAGLFAQHLGGADAGAHAAQRVGFQNGARRTAQVAVGNPLDEAGHVDIGGAGSLAGRVKTVQAALGFEHGLRDVQRWGGIGKVLRVLGGTKAAGTDIRGSGFWHGNSCGEASTPWSCTKVRHAGLALAGWRQNPDQTVKK